MSQLVKGYFRDKSGKVTAHEMYRADLNDACEKFPHEWAKTPDKFKTRKS